ncbi:MAG TPA: DUF2726 domain-containing protein [Chthoniobacterales bacterium]|jgi:hypothetical protein
MDGVLIVVLLAGFLGALAGIVLLGAQSARPAQFAYQPVQSHAIPFRRRTVLFSRAERSFYKALRALVPDHMIFIKVKLADLVSIKPRQSFWEHFSPIQRKEIDFVVCDQTLAPVLAIELADAKQLGVDAVAGDSVSSMLATASLPIVRIPAKRQYLFNEMRRLLTPYLAVPRPLL